MSGSHPTVHSERAVLSPADAAARIRRAARAIQCGVGVDDLKERGFSEREIKKAQIMAGKK